MEGTAKEMKAFAWHKLIYYLTRGDVTKTEDLMKTNANFIFHTLGFEKNNAQWVQNVR